MTIDKQKLPEFLRDGPYLRGGSETIRIMDAAADHIDALEASNKQLRNALNLFLAHSPEPECAIWRHVHAVARAALSGESKC